MGYALVLLAIDDLHLWDLHYVTQQSFMGYEYEVKPQAFTDLWDDA